MNKAEKQAILQFMNATLASIHTDIDSYGIGTVQTIFETYGKDSDEFERYPENVKQAFYMLQAIQKFTES